MKKDDDNVHVSMPIYGMNFCMQTQRACVSDRCESGGMRAKKGHQAVGTIDDWMVTRNFNSVKNVEARFFPHTYYHLHVTKSYKKQRERVCVCLVCEYTNMHTNALSIL